MGKKLLLMMVALLCPALADAQSTYRPHRDDIQAPFWLGVGFGGGSVNSTAPAPSAGRDAFAGSIDAGYRITPQWGLGLEFGIISPNGGCGGHHCTPAAPDFAPDFTHWFMVGEYRPVHSGLRLRAGLGVSSMCYRYYRSRESSFEQFLDSVLADALDDDSEDTTSWDCKSLQAFGASASIGYQWAMPDSRSSVGLQLRGEAADFAASGTASTPAFHHRAVTMQVQLNFK